MKQLRPSEAHAFDPREFARLFALAVRAGEAAGPRVGADPGGVVLDVSRADREPVPVSRPEGPRARAALALHTELGESGPGRYESAMFRFQALMHLVAGGTLGAWVDVTPGGGGRTRIHPAVLDVASTHRLGRNGRFPVRKFIEAVERTAGALYPDLAGWPAPPA